MPSMCQQITDDRQIAVYMDQYNCRYSFFTSYKKTWFFKRTSVNHLICSAPVRNGQSTARDEPDTNSADSDPNRRNRNLDASLVARLNDSFKVSLDPKRNLQAGDFESKGKSIPKQFLHRNILPYVRSKQSRYTS